MHLTVFVVFTDLDNLINMLLLQCSANNDEVILSLLEIIIKFLGL